MNKRSFLLDEMDPAVKPGENFYEYAIGNWRKRNPIPDDQSRWSIFDILRDENLAKLRGILEKEEKNEGVKNAGKVRKIYSLGMDEKKLNELGSEPLQPYLEKIDSLKNKEDVMPLLAEMHLMGARPFFNFLSSPDSKNSEWVIAQLYQGGLGLPEKEYYFSEDDKMKKIRQEYQKFIDKMFSFVGHKSDASGMVMKVETALAAASRTRSELRDVLRNYNKMGLEQLMEISKLPWHLFFARIELGKTDEIDVGQPDFFAGVAESIAEFSIEEIRTYLVWHLLLASADLLSHEFEDEAFNFYGRVIRGQPKMRDRWKRVTVNVDNLVGQEVGKIFVKKYFPPEAKERAVEMVKFILLAMEERIKGLDWMEDKTKAEAITKLNSFKYKIGYPDWWIDYDGLEIDERSYFDAVVSARKFEFLRDKDKIGKPVNHAEWFTPPQTVNAFYNPLDNEIFFPAGILQPPFFFADGDNALNYGGIGSVIGHEITHGFDDQGRMYDAKGNIRDWWTKTDEEKFKARSKKLVDQFNECKVEGESVNGELTLGENIADLGGLVVAYLALQKQMAGQNDPMIDGLSQAERFFLVHAHTYKENIRPETALLYLKIDPHSPDQYRVNIPFSNMDSFIETFKLKTEDQLYRKSEERVVIW